MQGLEIEAVYEHGTLKLPRELPLLEGATVKITIHPPGRPGVIKHLRIPWTGSREELERWRWIPNFSLRNPDDVSGHPLRAAVFVDTNIFLSTSARIQFWSSCDQLLQRIETETSKVYLRARLNEMAHRLMTEEAHQRFNWPMTASLADYAVIPLGSSRCPSRQAIDELSMIGFSSRR